MTRLPIYIKILFLIFLTVVAFIWTTEPLLKKTSLNIHRTLLVEGDIVPEDEEEDSSHQQSFALLALLMMELMCFFTAFLLKQTHFIYVQEAGAYILFGAIIGGFIRFVSNIERLQAVVTFDSEVFFLFLLPPIIFESGYTMKRSNFFKNIDGILLYAFVGTTIATFITALLLYAIHLAGWLSTPLTMLECLLFGSLISATDPVTVLAIFKELKVDIDLYSLVFGESVLNDAVAIVLYRTVLSFATQSVTAKSIFGGIGSFLIIFVGSTACGTIVALISALVYKYTELSQYPVLESAILVSFAYASYLLAEGLALSGIVAILFCGIVMAHYTYNNLSKTSQTLTVEMFQTIALLAETLVFVYLGLALFSFEVAFDWAFIGFGILLILLSRAAHVFPLSFLLNYFRPEDRKVTYAYQIFAWFSGLRGGIAFALALSLHSHPLFPAGTAIFTTTLVIAFFTVLALGGATVPVLKYLQIPMGVESSDTDPSSRPSKPAKGFLSFDRRFLKPIFTDGEKRTTANSQYVELSLARGSTE